MINVSCSRTQRSRAGEARPRGLSVSSQALYHWATALPTFCSCYGSLPHGADSWSVIFDCGISWLYPLAFYRVFVVVLVVSLQLCVYVSWCIGMIHTWSGIMIFHDHIYFVSRESKYRSSSLVILVLTQTCLASAQSHHTIRCSQIYEVLLSWYNVPCLCFTIFVLKSTSALHLLNTLKCIQIIFTETNAMNHDQTSLRETVWSRPILYQNLMCWGMYVFGVSYIYLLSVTSHTNCIVARCLINVVYLTACYLYQVMMTLHFLNDVANDAESTQKSKNTSLSLVRRVFNNG